MANQNQKTILQKYQDLPEDLREAIFSVESAEIIQQIAKKHNLFIDKMGILAEETGNVMLGLLSPNDFISALREKLEIAPETAREIGQEINQQIFAKVRESLKKIHNIQEEKSGAETPPIKESPLPSPPPPLSPSAPETIFEKKLEAEIHKTPKETKEISQEQLAQKYEGKDPYREPLE